MIKRSIHREDITFISVYATNLRAHKYTKQTLTELKEEIDSNIILVGKFQYSPLIMDRTTRQINKK